MAWHGTPSAMAPLDMSMGAGHAAWSLASTPLRIPWEFLEDQPSAPGRRRVRDKAVGVQSLLARWKHPFIGASESASTDHCRTVDPRSAIRLLSADPMRRHLWIVLDVLIAALVAILGSIVADYLQDHLSLLSDISRFRIIGVLFVVSLAIGIALRFRQRRLANTAQGRESSVRGTGGDTIQQIAGRDIRQSFYTVPPAVVYLLLIIAVLALTIVLSTLGSVPPSDTQPSFRIVPDEMIRPTPQPQTTLTQHGGLFGVDQDVTPPLVSGPVFLVASAILSISLILVFFYVAQRDKREV